MKLETENAKSLETGLYYSPENGNKITTSKQ